MALRAAVRALDLYSQSTSKCWLEFPQHRNMKGMQPCLGALDNAHRMSLPSICKPGCPAWPPGAAPEGYWRDLVSQPYVDVLGNPAPDTSILATNAFHLSLDAAVAV